MALASVAVPPLTLKAKSLASRAPEPDAVLKTFSEKDTTIEELSAAKVTELIDGDVLSKYHEKTSDDLFVFPSVSVNTSALILTVVAP